MARRRLNKKFVLILGGGFVGLVLLGGAAYRLRGRFFKQHPEKYIAAGRDALAKKDYATARENLLHAAGLSHPDADLNVMIGDALNGLSSKDPDNVAAARGAWEQALTIDPSNAAAMDRLIRFWQDELELHPRSSERAQAASQLQKAAAKLLVVDSDNYLAKSASAEATLETMVDGVHLEPARAKAAEDQLLKLAQDNPSDADLPFFVARAYVFQGQEAGRSDDAAAQARFYAAADKVMADAVNRQPGDGEMHYRYGQILLQIVSGSMHQNPIPESAKAVVAHAVQEVDIGRQIVSPANPHYVDINLYGARLALERPSYAPDAPLPSDAAAANSSSKAATQFSPRFDPEATAPVATSRVKVAEAIYRNVLLHRPNDPAIEIALAELLGNFRNRRDEAIAILSKPLVDAYPVPGIKGTLLNFLQTEASIHLLGLEIDSVEASHDPQKRQELLNIADTQCDKVFGKSPDVAAVLGMKGRLQLLHGRVVEATQTLRHALALTDPQDASQQRGRYELVYTLARASEAAQQTGDAKKLAIELVKVYPHFIPARMMLARLLITEHDFDDAKTQIDFLESVLPTNPELATSVVRMRIATLDPTKDADKVKQYYDRLPEETRDQRMDKAAFAHLVKFDGDAVRLATLVHHDNPGDAEAAVSLANWYQAHDQKPQALTILSEALAVNPSDGSLLATQLQVEGKSQAGNAAQNQVAHVQPQPQPQPQPQTPSAAPTDPFNVQIAQAQVARANGDLAGVDAHLAAAEKIKPDDVRVWDAIFMRAIDQLDWDKASLYMEKLASANADRAGGLLYRVRFAVAKNDLKRAMELATELTREKPEFSQSWSVLGQVQKSAGNYQDAIANFGQALERQTQNLDAIRGLVDCSYAVSDPIAAKRYIDMGRRVAPSNEAFQELELSHELNYGDPQKAIEPRRQAVQASPEQPQRWANLVAAYLAAAKSRQKANDSAGASNFNQQAVATLAQAMAKFPDDGEFVASYSKVALEIGDFAGAEKSVLDFASRPVNKGRAAGAIMLSDFYVLARKEDQAVKVLSDYLAAPFQPADHTADLQVELQLSGLLAKQNRIDDALAVLSANAQDPAVVRQKVGILINSGRNADADKILDAQASAGPLNPDLLSLKGVAALNAGKLSEARDCFDQVLAAQPNNVYALSERAEVAIRETPPNYVNALADLSKARDLSPRTMETRLQIVDVDRRRNQPDDAINELESALQIVPGNKRVRLTLLDLYANSKPPRLADAQRVLRDARQIPQLADDADLLHAEAAMDLNRGDYTKAGDAIRSAMAKEPGNFSMVRTYYDILIKTKAFEQLLSHSTDLLASNQNAPALWWVYPYRAQARFSGTADRPGAADELDHGVASALAAHDSAAVAQIVQSYAVLLGPDAAIKVATAHADTDPHWTLLTADLYRRKGDANNALLWLEKALDRFDSLTPADQDTTLHLAAVEYLQKSPPDPLKSADMYRRIVKRSPTDVDSMNNLACILSDPGSPAFEPREARDFSERAYNLMVQAGSDDPLIKDTYGWTLIANDKNDEGVKLVQDALGQKDFAEGHYHLAEGFLKRQPPSPEDAASELTKAAQMLDQAERDGKPVDQSLKLRVQDELKRAKTAMAG